jgi:hypothetical protein
MLSWISFFKILTRVFPKLRNGFFIDSWVLGNTLLAFISILIVKAYPNIFINWVLVVYSSIRIFEIVVYQINVLLFDEYRTKKRGERYVLRGYKRMVLLLLHNLFEIVFWFSFVYAFFTGYFEDNIRAMNVFRLIGSSFSIMTTFGQNEIQYNCNAGYLVILFQSFCGIIMSVMSLARFIGLLPMVESKDEFEN